MNRDEALSALESHSHHDRLQGARALSTQAMPADLPSLRAAISRESVEWVRKALEDAERHALRSRAVPAILEPVESPDQAYGPLDSDTIADQARSEIARIVVHELEPLIGLAEEAASHEIGGYGASTTYTRLRRIRDALRTLRSLAESASPAQTTDFDLAECVHEAVNGHRANADVVLSLRGEEPTLVTGERATVLMVLRNALANAFEAALQGTHGRGPARIVVTWGVNDRAAWLAVLDNGPGPPNGGIHNPQFGASTKPGHFGIGLALTARMATRLGGDTILEPAPGGWTRYQFSWPQ
jgi:signal transduction histidine kinase